MAQVHCGVLIRNGCDTPIESVRRDSSLTSILVLPDSCLPEWLLYCSKRHMLHFATSRGLRILSWCEFLLTN